MTSLGTHTYSLKDLHLILTILTLATAPFTKVNNVMICLFFAHACYAAYKSPPSFSKIVVIQLLPALLFLSYAFGIIWSNDLKEGLHQVAKRLHLIVFPVAFFMYQDKFTKRDIDRILACFVLICLLASVICYVTAAINVISNGSFTVILERKYYYFSYSHLTKAVNLEPIYSSLFVNFCILILLHRRFQLPSFVKWSIIGYFVVFNVLVAAKIGMLCMIAIFLVYGLFSISNRLLRIGISVIAPLILIATIFVSPFLKDRFILPLEFEYDSAYAGTWNSFTQRLAIWTCSIEAIKEIFPLGYGTGDGKQALHKAYMKKNYTRGIEDNYNAHNEFIHTLLELGIFGLFIFIGVLAVPMVLSIRYSHKLLLFFMILLFFYFFVEVVLTRRLGVFFFSFFYSLLVTELVIFIPTRKLVP